MKEHVGISKPKKHTSKIRLVPLVTKLKKQPPYNKPT